MGEAEGDFEGAKVVGDAEGRPVVGELVNWTLVCLAIKSKGTQVASVSINPAGAKRKLTLTVRSSGPPNLGMSNVADPAEFAAVPSRTQSRSLTSLS